MITLLIIIHVFVCFFLIAIVLLQHGKGADAGATFGGGSSSQSLFGSEGPLPLLNKITTFSAIVFMGTSVTLAYYSAHKSTGSVMSKLPAKEAATPVKKEVPITIPMPQEKPDAVVKTEEKKPVEKSAVQPEQVVPVSQQAASLPEKVVAPAAVPVEQKQTQAVPVAPAEKKAK
jgi:preprotein translocase subunit SecG